MTARSRYVALLRGINVGGKNPVPMARLRAALESAGFTGVQTYIQSGNVVFEGSGSPPALEDRLEALLLAEFGFPLTVVVRTEGELRTLVDEAPEGFGTEPGRYHCDVVFLKGPLTSAGAMRVISTREGVDRAWAASGVIYFQRLSERRTASRLSRVMGTPEYRLMTIRNWATTTRLLTMLDARGHDGT